MSTESAGEPQNRVKSTSYLHAILVVLMIRQLQKNYRLPTTGRTFPSLGEAVGEIKEARSTGATVLF